MNSLQEEYFSQETSLPDLRSPFNSIDQNPEPNSAQASATAPAIEPESFRKEATAQAIKGLNEKEPAGETVVTSFSPSADDEMVSRAQLCQIFEQFIGQLKAETPGAVAPVAQIESPVTSVKVQPISVNDRTEEIDQLKSLLIEAQETIIKLLTDRVDDRSKIATLEMEMKYLPGPRLSSDDQARMVIEHEKLRSELVKVKLELEQLEKVHANFKLKQKKQSFWVRFWQSLQV